MINLLLILQLLAVSQCLAGNLTPEENRKRAAECGILEDSQMLDPFIDYEPPNRSPGATDVLTVISPRHVISNVQTITYTYDQTVCKEKNNDVTGMLRMPAVKGTLIGSCDKSPSGFLILEVNETFTQNKPSFCLPTSPLPSGHSVRVIVRDSSSNLISMESQMFDCNSVDPKKLCFGWVVRRTLGPVFAKTDDGRYSAIGARTEEGRVFWSYHAFKDEICAASGVCSETTLSSVPVPVVPVPDTATTTTTSSPPAFTTSTASSPDPPTTTVQTTTLLTDPAAPAPAPSAPIPGIPVLPAPVPPTLASTSSSAPPGSGGPSPAPVPPAAGPAPGPPSLPIRHKSPEPMARMNFACPDGSICVEGDVFMSASRFSVVLSLVLILGYYTF